MILLIILFFSIYFLGIKTKSWSYRYTNRQKKKNQKNTKQSTFNANLASSSSVQTVAIHDILSGLTVFGIRLLNFWAAHTQALRVVHAPLDPYSEVSIHSWINHRC